MQHFQYQNNILHAENVNLNEIAAQFGTPCYVYSRAALEESWNAFHQAFDKRLHQICYAVKANSNLSILKLLAEKNSGFDIVSVGELERVLAAGGDPKKIIFSGVGKQTHEIIRALEIGIGCFNLESAEELERIHTIAKQLNKIAPVALRINPNIDANTHPYIATGLNENKFGIELTETLALCRKITTLPHLKLLGIGCHIGSQLTDMTPFIEAIDCLLELIEQLKQENITLEHIDIGGGLGIQYQTENPPSIQEYVSTLRKRLDHLPLKIMLEPGRVMIANAGILLTRVEYLKQTAHKNFVIVDTAMNDLLRPALYDAWQNIIPVNQSKHTAEIFYDVVGPVCESADFLGKNRQLAVQQNDLLAICSAGAYGFSMSSNYNSRPRVAEILVDENKISLIRRRETIAELFELEKL